MHLELGAHIVRLAMQDRVLAAEIRQAVEEVQAYLSDQLAPLLVLDAVEVLLGQPVALGAETILGWTTSQVRAPGSATTLGDYFFHAVNKIQLLGKLRLIDRKRLQAYVDDLIEVLVAQVPQAEVPALRAHLRQASEADANLAVGVQVLHRPAGAARPGAVGSIGVGAPATPPEITASMRQFALLLTRLGGGGKGKAAGDRERLAAGSGLASQLLVTATESARSQGELEQLLASLSRAGLMSESRYSELFSTLSQGVADWWVGGEAGEPVYESAPVQAMQRIVELAEDPSKAAVHFRELLKTVAKLFNEGSLARAVQVQEVARRLLAEGKVERTMAHLILEKAHEDLDPGRLMAQTQQAGSLPQLRRLLDGYPVLTPHGLLVALDDEPDRSRRRLWLALVEAHGAAGRRAALERLESSFDLGEAYPHLPWLRRNFVYLLHRIRPAEGEDVALEVQLSARSAALGGLAQLVREALTHLGLLQHPEAEAVLRQRLSELERLLEQPGNAPYDPPELRRMLGMVVSGLVRHGTQSARRAVLDHGLSQKPHLGDAMERLVELGAVDLAEDPALVERLVAALRAKLPLRVLGMSLRRNVAPLHLVRALHSTRCEPVRQAFEEIATRFPQEPFGEAAAAALASWRTVPDAPSEAVPAGASAAVLGGAAAAASLAGDLEAFGLPELLQTLTQTEASGRLLLRAPDRSVVGELVLRKGALRDARVGELPMPDAFCQLLEVPRARSFEFTRQPAEAVPDGPCRDVTGLLMEGMRRYDELQRARALAPDHAFLRATGERPTPPEHERDGAFLRELWTRVKGGASPLECEQAVVADAYRIRTGLAHWLTDGALEVGEATPDAPP
ncbi:MAG TPA: DUF4388 domain-containing protein [Thermoanaerobaculia bacterium]|nr:DUF4388 domain-containing protein [Thermoanaerobaculia bacterium]